MAMTSSSLRKAVTQIVAILPALETELNAADSRLGDGDTGTMLTRVIKAMDEATVAPGAALDEAFITYAKATMSATGSSLGTLVATGLMSAAKRTKGRMEAPWSELGDMLADARDAMSARGGAALGDKTVLDALDAVSRSVVGLTQADGIGMAASTSARATLEEFRDRPNKMGRARMFADASKGLDDPGMLALTRIVDAIGR